MGQKLVPQGCLRSLAVGDCKEGAQGLEGGGCGPEAAWVRPGLEGERAGGCAGAGPSPEPPCGTSGGQGA